VSLPASMRAAVYRGRGSVRVEDVPVPEIGPGELLVRVEACGVCPTDLKKIEKGLLPPPRIFGHETAGVVARRGAGVSRFREGDRVALHHHVPCLRCFYCSLSLYAQCETYKRNGTTAGFEPAGGGFAQYVRVMDWIVERGVVPVPAGVLPEEAAFVEPVNTCLKAVDRLGVRPGQLVLVVGQGPIGLILLQIARELGAEVIASDVRLERLETSRALGAQAAFDGRGDVPSELRARSAGRGADHVLLAAVGQQPFDQAVAAARPGGRIMVFAATSPGETVTADLGALCAAEKEILTSYSASVDVQERAARLIFERRVRVRELVSHRLPLEEAPRAFELAARAEPGVLKVVVQPEE
jgi:L-iditol 2-dehydrogenase